MQGNNVINIQNNVYNNYFLDDKVFNSSINTPQARLKELLDSMDKLSGFELEELKNKFDAKFEKLSQLDRNYNLHDFIDDYTYIVYYNDDSFHYYSKGQEAYKSYLNSGVKLERKTKDLYPTYESLLNKPNVLTKVKGDSMSKTKYDLQYQKDNVKQVKFTLNRNTDQDIIEHLENQTNVNGYLKNLVRKDICSILKRRSKEQTM